MALILPSFVPGLSQEKDKKQVVLSKEMMKTYSETMTLKLILKQEKWEGTQLDLWEVWLPGDLKELQ